MSGFQLLPEVGFVSEPVVLMHVGMSKSSWQKLIKAGDAPRPKKLSERMTRYDASEIRAWIVQKVAAATSPTQRVG